MDIGLKDRLEKSANDFWVGVRPRLERLFQATVHTVEKSRNNEISKLLDRNGIDAYLMDQQGRIRGLSSRVNWTRFKTAPNFTFRYAKQLCPKQNTWDTHREYHRLLELINNQEGYHYPALHVECFSNKKASGDIRWAYAARVPDILNYIDKYVDHERSTYKRGKGVHVFTPRIGEPRKVISVSIEALAKEYEIFEIVV